MDDTLNLGIFLEYVLEGFEVAAVNLLESGADAFSIPSITLALELDKLSIITTS